MGLEVAAARHSGRCSEGEIQKPPEIPDETAESGVSKND